MLIATSPTKSLLPVNVDASGNLKTAPAELTAIFACGTVSPEGPTAIVAAPAAGYRLVVAYLNVAPISTLEGEIAIFGDGATPKLQFALPTAGSSANLTFPPDCRFKLTAATALTLNGSGNTLKYTVIHYTEAA